MRFIPSHRPTGGTAALAQALVGTQSPAIARHSREVAAYATAVADRLGLPLAEVRDIRCAALLHDIGKADVPADVLAKPGVLTVEEHRLMRTHAERGEARVARERGLDHLAGVVRHVHERWDGTGYPDGLAGAAIPRDSRIIAACDAFVAMREPRSYGRRRTHEEAVRELRLSAGTQLDPLVVSQLAVILADQAAAARKAARARVDAVVG